MLDKMRQILSTRFSLVWGAVLFLVLFLLGGRALSLAQISPSLTQVLTHKVGHSASTWPDFSLLVASLLAMSLATMSAAKGYELVKRNRPMANAILPEFTELPRLSEEVAAIETKLTEKEGVIESLRKHIEQLNKGKDWVHQENSGLKEKLGNLTSAGEEISRAEKMLRKSNISLSKECERLKAENEMLLLKISSLAIKPKRVVGRVVNKSSKVVGKRKLDKK